MTPFIATVISYGISCTVSRRNSICVTYSCLLIQWSLWSLLWLLQWQTELLEIVILTWIWWFENIYILRKNVRVISYDYHGFANQWQIDHLFNSWFRLTTRKHKTLHHWSFVRGIPCWAMASHHKEAVMWSIYLYHVIKQRDFVLYYALSSGVGIEIIHGSYWWINEFMQILMIMVIIIYW